MPLGRRGDSPAVVLSACNWQALLAAASTVPAARQQLAKAAIKEAQRLAKNSINRRLTSAGRSC